MTTRALDLLRHELDLAPDFSLWRQLPAKAARYADFPDGLDARISALLGSRGIEWELLPYCQKANIMVMAYSPLGQGPILRMPALKAIAGKHGCDPAAIALAWVLRQPGVIAIPKATNPEHVRANLKALDLELDAEDLAALDAVFPPPKRAGPLEMT